MGKIDEKLGYIIRENIKKILEKNEYGVLFEMVLPRKAFKERVRNIMPQVLENWCLVKISSGNSESLLNSHWRGELRGHLLTLSRFSLSNNDSKQSRLKVFKEVWDEDDFGLPEILNMTIANKFMIENFDIKSEEYGNVLYDCISSIDEIFDIVLTRNIDQINKYVKNV